MKRLYTMALCAMCAVSASADNQDPVLVVNTTAQESKEIVLSNISKITYSDDSMIITLRNGGTETILLDDITTMTFSNVVSSITKMGFDTDNTVTVTDLGGNNVWNGNIKDMPRISGVYVVKQGEKVNKVLIK